MDSYLNLVAERARLTESTRAIRRNFTECIDELVFALSTIQEENEDLRARLSDKTAEASKLKSVVSNYEKLVSARDRFGCWLCAKHERESVEEDFGEEKEMLRNENLALRGEIKMLERRIETIIRQQSPIRSHTRPTLRSSLRSSDETDSRAERHIRFSHRESVGSRRASTRPSVQKKVSLDAPPSPEHKKSPVMTFTTAALVLNAAQALKSGVRKSRSKQALFGSDSTRSPAWTVRFSPSDKSVSPEEVEGLVKVMSSIEVCRSAAETHADIEAIARAMTPIRVNPGDTVCKQGEPGLFFMVISEGAFLSESLDSPTRDLGPSDFFGDEIFVHPYPLASSSVTCTQGGLLWAIHTDALRQVLKESGIRQVQQARETLDCCPKILRDSMNASQFASICSSASLATFSQLVEWPAGAGLLVVVDSELGIPGTVFLDSKLMPIKLEKRASKVLSITQREIDSIPPLAVAISNLKKSESIKMDGIPKIQKSELQSVCSTPPSEEPPYHHPLSPALRPDLTEADVAHILLFSLLSVSGRTHLVNKAHFITIAYDSADEGPIILHLGLVLVLSGTAVIRLPSGKCLLLDQGHAAGLGQGSPDFNSQVAIDPDRNTFDLEDNVPPPVVIAYWSEATVRNALPVSIRQEANEESLVSFMKKRKLLIRNPIFQFLPDRLVEQLVQSCHTIKLDHNRSLTASVSREASFLVIEGSVTVGDSKLNIGDFWNSECLVCSTQDEDDGAGLVESTKSEESENDWVVACHSIRAEVLIISKSEFGHIIQQIENQTELVTRIHAYLKTMREQVDLGDLKIGKTIGRGGTAVVKLATIPKEELEEFYALKVIKKKLLEKHNKLGLLKNERFILQQLSSDFIIKLRATFRDTRNLYFLLELAPGGDLLSVINSLGILKRSQARFYLGCMVRALEYCHSKGIVYRDLKPENLLVDSKGYLKLADFGVAKKISPKFTTYSLVGTPQFMAPETILGKGYGLSVDLWALGCCLYELMVGELPLNETNGQFELFQSIIHFDAGKSVFDFDPVSQDLIRSLLTTDPHARIGCSVGLGIQELESHAFFTSSDNSMHFDWKSLDNRTLLAPFVPEIRPLSTLFDAGSEAGTEEGVPAASPALSAVSWTSFDHPRTHMDTTLTWDF
jgi:serine/threonine protein kinase